MNKFGCVMNNIMGSQHTLCTAMEVNGFHDCVGHCSSLTPLHILDLHLQQANLVMIFGFFSSNPNY